MKFTPNSCQTIFNEKEKTNRFVLKTYKSYIKKIEIIKK